MAQASEQAFVCQGESNFELIPIWSLSDDLLSKIFSYLQPNDRFQLAEICTRWARVSRMDWTDVTSLDLSPIPKENIGPIIQLCPKLDSITAHDCELNLRAVSENLRSELKTLSLYRVFANVGLVEPYYYSRDAYSETVFRELRSLTCLQELILYEIRIGNAEFSELASGVPFHLSSTLKRLQLCYRCWSYRGADERLSTSPSLDCLIAEPQLFPYVMFRSHYGGHLRYLRELCLSPFFDKPPPNIGAELIKRFSRLEIFCIDLRTNYAYAPDLLPLFSSHPTLRILLITGEIAGNADETLIPPRRRYPNGLGSDPLPLLHVFIGGQIAEKFRFARAPNDALETHPITLPMPQFLEQPEVAAIFKGSWMAEMITKGAKANSRLWDYDARIAQSVLVLNP